ncbi:hypothetical protein ACG94X_03755 [Acinetobacter sp. ULE_I010]|uniref:hypothetical protein n=1 Tax=Acinetobacter sp. ULE_I010 TaxID=3373065 RepID=UPI003AF4EA52
MKKITTLLTAGLLTVISASAIACPKGTTLVGGTGPNHKGGSCVAVNPAAQAAQKAKADAAKTKVSTTKAQASTQAVADKAKTDATLAKSKADTTAKAKVDTAAKAKMDMTTKTKADVATKTQAVKDKAVKTTSTNPLKP